MISAVILTKNEAANIADCLTSLSFCNEILVVDDASTDKTVEIARKFGARVFVHRLENDFSKQRNFALEKAKNDWVLFVDADERVSADLKKEIIEKTHNRTNHTVGFYVKRYDFLWGQKLSHGEIGSLTFLRLIKKHSGAWEGQVHETLETSGKTETLVHPLLHYPHPTITEFLEAINIYSTMRAEELYKKNVQVGFFDILVYPTGKFIQNYLLRLGFLDKTPGLIFAIIMSLHSFLVRGKLWMLWQKK